MEYTIKNIWPLTFMDDNKSYSLNGYAFIDVKGFCIIIVYGERRRDAIIDFLC